MRNNFFFYFQVTLKTFGPMIQAMIRGCDGQIALEVEEEIVSHLY
jgi:hypothetical protein